MILGTVLTPCDERNMALAAQCGVEGVVHRYPGPGAEAIHHVQDQLSVHGLKLLAIEGFLPFESIILGTDDGTELAAMKNLVRHMGAAGVPLLCYNWMAGTDWVRTTLDAPERAGARVTAFDLTDAMQAVSLTDHAAGVPYAQVSGEELWHNLETFLRELVPLAEAAGVTLAMHPDDPPLPEFYGRARIMNCVESFERLVQLVPSPANAVCFCQGSFATMGVDIPKAIRTLGDSIAYVHFRDVLGGPTSFRETFHDNGPTDMASAIRTLKEIGFGGPIRPDHVPQLFGEDDGDPGYTMLGRLFAFGYIRGLLHGN